MEHTHAICYIAGALPLERELLPDPQPGDLIIAADRGFEQLAAFGLLPDLLVGDFDSMPAPQNFPSTLRLPHIKDETDVGYALEEGLRRGYRRFVLLGCLGGKLDHTMANLQQLLRLNAHGAMGFMVGEGQCAAAITNAALTFPAEMSGRISLFCAGTPSVHVTLKGLKYPLEEHLVAADFPLCVSNEFLGIPSSVTVRGGSLWAIWDDMTPLLPLPKLFYLVNEGGIVSI